MNADFAEMDALSLNYWFSKFVMEVAKTFGERSFQDSCVLSGAPDAL